MSPFIVGELINSTRKSIAEAITAKNVEFLKELARRQASCGASAIDINTAATGDEIENMKWLIEILQDDLDVPLCIDSPNYKALETGLSMCRLRPVVNSITAEKTRWDEVLPLVQEFKTSVIALCMDDSGIPETIDQRLTVADKLVSGLVGAGISEEHIFLDPLIKPLSVNHLSGMEILEGTRRLRELFPRVHIISGLSNISFGLPERRLLNRAYMIMSVAAGMDSFILDPLDSSTVSLLSAAWALAGCDEYCLDYISAFRSGNLRA